jgi:hypothetical protein
VEGDAPKVHWREIPAFLRRIEYDRQTLRPDGFERISRSALTKVVIEQAAQ